MTIAFRGAAKRLDDIDIPRIGSAIGVGEDEVHAFMEVEASGSGFDDEGRIKALFEPHKFYGLLNGKKLEAATKAGLAYPKWGMKPYPRDSYPRILQACEIDESAALKATSWGLGQILGVHHAICEFQTPQAMVKAFAADEENQLAAMIEFVKHEGIDDDMRAHRWEILARVYNGPGYAKHNYHGRLADAYAKWRRIKDTPFNKEG